MALGVPPRALALRPVLMGVQISLLGVALGIATGVAFAGWLSDVFREQLPLPSYATAFRGDVFVRAAALGFLLPLAATVYPVWRGVRVPPIEAIRVGFHAAKGGGFAPLLKRIRLPGSSLAQMPLRNVVRAPRRTIMTMLGLAAVITTVVSLSGMFDSFAATVDEIEQRDPAREPESAGRSPRAASTGGIAGRQRDRERARSGCCRARHCRSMESCAPEDGPSTSPLHSCARAAGSGRQPSSTAGCGPAAAAW